MKLYSYFRSSASYRVRIALNLKGLPYETVPVHLLKDGGQQFNPDFLQLNPDAVVPALVDENDSQVALTQSLAIIEYLEETHPEPPLLPKDAYGRARCRELAYVVACDIHPVNNLRIGQYMKRAFGKTDEDVFDWHRHWIRLGFDALEKMLASSPHTGKFCHGDMPTIADVCLIPQVANARRVKLEIEVWPTIARIETHALTYPAFDAALPKNQPDAE